MIIPDKPRKTAAELKLLIEEKLLAGHPDCERAEVVIILPPLNTLGQPPSSASDRPSFECRRKLEGIVEQLRDQFDLLI